MIVVTGMHRSGTSMVAHVLSGLGVYLGPQAELCAPAEDNSDGFWENRNHTNGNPS